MDGAWKAMHDHGCAVTNQDTVDLGIVNDLGRSGVVTGDHGNGPAQIFFALEFEHALHGLLLSVYFATNAK